ncbi:MAG: glycosyltransferase family 2 protein [Candidatus Levybacteria bacterium]|nr:glycosyltransferase family 2 protein [Candidatus Levybacteria bacterium]
MIISVVIPNYNGQEIIKKNLPKVLVAVEDAEVIVVDDFSADDSLKVLDDFKHRIKVIKNEKNLGFSSTVNKGVKEAKGEIVVLLNTDVSPEKDFLSPLLSHFKDERVFAVGCMDKSIENGKTVLRGRGIGSWKRGFLVHSRGGVNKTGTLWVSGGSGAFRKSIWDRLNGFNSLYSPFYWEDIDLSYRAVKSGYRVLFEPKSIVVHEHEKGAIKKNLYPSQIKTIAYRNQFIFVWKNITDLDLQLSHIFWLPYYFLKAFIKVDIAFFLGFLSALIRIPKIVQANAEEKKLFVLRDSQVLS